MNPHRFEWNDDVYAYVCELCGATLTEENKEQPCPQAPPEAA